MALSTINTLTDSITTHHQASYCRKAAYKQARLALDHEEKRSSSYLVSGISRIRPSHDALHRDKFSYHGGIHTEQDDLIAMTFIDTLQSSLSPENRALSPEPDTAISTDELFAKINTLRNCVEQLQVFQPALSDDGHVSIHSFQNMDQHSNISTGSSGEHVVFKKEPEHGSILGIEHKHSINKGDIGSKPNVFKLKNTPPQPGLFMSQSHGMLPSNKISHFNHLPKDIFPRFGPSNALHTTDDCDRRTSKSMSK